MTTTSEHKRDGNHGEDAGQDHRNFDGVRCHVCLLLRKAFAASFRLNFSPRSESRGGSSTCRRARRAASIAAAMVRRARMRAALDHLARGFHVGKIGIAARFFPAAARIFRDAATPSAHRFCASDRRHFRIALVGAHAEGAAGYPDHAGRNTRRSRSDPTSYIPAADVSEPPAVVR
jgi:hypothetical protein